MSLKNKASRKVLKNKMAEVFSEQINKLPTELQYILLDDLVTALENRLEVLNKVESRVQMQCVTSFAVKDCYQKIEA